MKTIANVSRSALIIAMLSGASAAVAQDVALASAEVVDDAAPAGQTIIVTGTRRTDRSVTDSPSPVDVISAADLETQPSSDMLEVVRNVVPSFFVAQNTITDASTFVRAPSLRGLPADEILVMVNGKRYNRSALVQVAGGGDTALSIGSQGADISLIPSISIGNLQVLREGATAQYGSDAIAGVLNYVLKTDPGLEIMGRYGQYYDNGGDGESKLVAANVGLKVGDSGFINISGEWFDDNGTSRGETRPNAAAFAAANPSLASQLPNYPGPVQIWGSSPTDGWKLMLNSSFDVGPGVALYLFGNLAHSKADQSFNYRPVQAFALTDTAGVVRNSNPNAAFSHPIYLTQCPAGNATCPAGGFVLDTNVYNFRTLYPAGFTPRFVGVKDQAYGVVGVKGDFEGFTYDLSASLSRNSLDLSMYSSLSPSYGPLTQTAFEFGQLIQKEFDVNLDLTYPIEVGFASPITLAFGGEFRRETYTSTPGDEQSYGAGPYAFQALYRQTAPGVYAFDSNVGLPPAASGYGGTSPDSAGTHSQKSYGVYASAETDITDTLTVGIAGRYEHYNTFGNATVGKINAIWKATPSFAIRGTIGTGFHAPSPGQSFTQIVTTTFVAGDQVQVGTYPVNNPIAQYYGAVPLTPEESTNFGLGFVFDPSSSVTLTVDAYQIEVDDRISITSTFDVTATDVAAMPILATVGAGGSVQYFTNGFDTRTRGVDVVATYRSRLFESPLNLTLAYNYNKSKVTDFDPVAIGADRISDISNFAPKHRVNLSGNWSIGDFTLTARENYYSSWSTEQDYPGDSFGSEFTTDIDVSYTFRENYMLSVGASNLFNNYPDKISYTTANPIYVLTQSTGDGQVYPRSGGPFGINGGFWYARVRVKY